VAAGILPLGLGTQTVGSVIRPAAFCGIVGLKASFGAVPRAGAFPVSDALDHVGFLARSVNDVAYAFNLLRNLTSTEPDSIAVPQVPMDAQSGLEPRLCAAASRSHRICTRCYSRAHGDCGFIIWFATGSRAEFRCPCCHG
jgi:Asp-tRNA(Asn)/Glu-tRNA(Gln) amidotransferase A subunit family amidase